MEVRIVEDRIVEVRVEDRVLEVRVRVRAPHYRGPTAAGPTNL